MENIDEIWNISNIKEKAIVAFKTKEGVWFTGQVSFISSDSIRVNLIVPIEPQWYREDDTTVYFLEDITEIVLLESIIK